MFATGINNTSRTGGKICRQSRWYLWQIMGTISGWTGWNKMYLYVNSTTQRCPNKIFKTFLIEDFFHLPPVSTTLVDHLELRISSQIFQKTWNGPIGILRGLEEMIHVYYIYSRILWTLFELLTTPSNFCALQQLHFSDVFRNQKCLCNVWIRESVAIATIQKREKYPQLAKEFCLKYSYSRKENY